MEKLNRRYKELLAKEKPAKLIYVAGHWECPICTKVYVQVQFIGNYCSQCGQKITK